MPTSSQARDPAGSSASSSRLGQTVLEDLHRTDLTHTFQQDLKDVYQFYLDPQTRQELASMSQTKRWFYLTFWLLKSSILRLSPSRRLLLLGSLIFFAYGLGGSTPFLVAGFAVLLLVLILELKDKLMAQDELDTGRAVQAALLPRDHPYVPGWDVWLYTRPANDVGGDLVDYLPLEDGRLGLALGDVAGKGLGAALLMAKLQSTLRAIAPGYANLADLGVATNRIFRRDGLPNRFISLVYLVLEPDSGHVRLLNAGHLPPVLLRNRSIQELPKGGPALGLMDGAVFTEQEITLAPDDYLIVFSDGLTEARNEAGTFFGYDRLRGLLPRLQGLSAPEAGHRILDHIARFMDGARASDDLSLIVLRRRSAATPSGEADAPAARTRTAPAGRATTTPADETA